MSIKSYISVEPVRFASALLAFGVALSAALALVASAPVVTVFGGLWVAGVGIFNALYVRNNVTPEANLEAIIHDTIVALAEAAPAKV